MVDVYATSDQIIDSYIIILPLTSVSSISQDRLLRKESNAMSSTIDISNSTSSSDISVLNEVLEMKDVIVILCYF